MKASLSILFIFLTFTLNSQTIYTYTSSGNWTTQSNWSPNYPGTTLAASDEVIITTGANLTTTGITTINGKLTIEGSYESNSILNINGEIVNNGSFTNRSILNNKGTITINSPVENRSIFTNEGLLIIKARFDNNSTFTTGDGGITENQSTLNSNSSINTDFGGTLKNTGTINSISTIKNNGTLNNEGIINCGSLINNNTIVNSTGSIVFNSSGYSLIGNNVSHTGDHIISNRLAPRTSVDVNYVPISPINPIGTYLFNDNVTFQTSSRVLIDLKSDLLFDTVNIGNSAILNGTLQITLLDSYDPPIGTTFAIINANDNVSGTFQSTSLPSLGVSKEFQINYNLNSVELEVISSSILELDEFNNSKNKLLAYPNPFIDIIHFKGILKNETLKIYTLEGKIILKTNISPYNTSISLGHLSKGIYILAVENRQIKIVK